VVRARGAAAGRTARGRVTVEPESTETVYRGSLIDVVVERWDGRVREIVEPPNAVAIVPVDEEGYVTLVRQLREAARAELLELPAGGLEPGETPLECARRELAEETGLTGGSWRHAASFYTTPGFCRERMDLFFAEGLRRGTPAPGADEQFEHVRVLAAELDRLLPQLEDAKTLAGLLLYLKLESRRLP
jgi:ADP-ribose pyrophosphatase